MKVYLNSLDGERHYCSASIVPQYPEEPNSVLIERIIRKQKQTKEAKVEYVNAFTSDDWCWQRWCPVCWEKIPNDLDIDLEEENECPHCGEYSIFVGHGSKITQAKGTQALVWENFYKNKASKNPRKVKEAWMAYHFMKKHSDLWEENEEGSKDLPIQDVPNSIQDNLDGSGVSYEPNTHMTNEDFYREWRITDIIKTALFFGSNAAIKKGKKEREKNPDIFSRHEREYLAEFVTDDKFRAGFRPRDKKIVLIPNGDGSFRYKNKYLKEQYTKYKEALRRLTTPKKGVYKKGNGDIHIHVLKPTEDMKEGYALKWRVKDGMVVDIKMLTLWISNWRHAVKREIGENYVLVDLAGMLPKINYAKNKNLMINDAINWIAKYSQFEGSN